MKNDHLNLSERVNVEFKSSLFFRAGTQECGEDQIGVIIRTIAGFMNAEGENSISVSTMLV